MAKTKRSAEGTLCESCGAAVVLDEMSADGTLIGGDCPGCGYYVTRYTSDFIQSADWLESEDD